MTSAFDYLNENTFQQIPSASFLRPEYLGSNMFLDVINNDISTIDASRTLFLLIYITNSFKK